MSSMKETNVTEIFYHHDFTTVPVFNDVITGNEPVFIDFVNPAQFWQFNMAIALTTYGMAFISLLGVFGNLLVILTLALQVPKLISTHFYLIYLAVNDMGHSLVWLMNSFPRFDGIIITELHPWVCKLWSLFFRYTTVQSS